MKQDELKTGQSGCANRVAGWTLIELVITVTVLTILTLAVVPLVQNTIKRQRETQLREALRDMRKAIDEFHRDTAGVPSVLPQCSGSKVIPGAPPIFYVDPRSRVVIADQRIFNFNENPDCYPPDLETLVNGVSIIPRLQTVGTGGPVLATKKKVYLRAIPVDPMTGKAEWDVRSCYDEPNSTSTGGENVFDVRSKSTDTALNGEKYSDW